MNMLKPWHWEPLDFSTCSTVCLSSLTKGWDSRVTSLRNFCTVPSAIFSSMASGLPASLAFSMATRRSVSIRSWDTPEASRDLGLEAAMCMAMSLAMASSPEMSTRTPILLPWM
jgi:hypothetical protein